MSIKSTARKELALIYPNRGTGRSATWLKERPWISMHHHVCMRVVKVLRNGTIEDMKQIKVVGEGLRSDFARLARRLLNRSIGLVLGGGGARGFAHAGIIRALDEAGIPIDMVGGSNLHNIFQFDLYKHLWVHLLVEYLQGNTTASMCIVDVNILQRGNDNLTHTYSKSFLDMEEIARYYLSVHCLVLRA